MQNRSFANSFATNGHASVIAEKTRKKNLKLCHLCFSFRYANLQNNLETRGEVISLTADMQTFGAQWGKTDKVTYI